jgi:arylsulfatase A-like enzyme
VRTTRLAGILLSVLLVSLALAGTPRTARPATAASRPNVLLILLDDWSINDSPQSMPKAMHWFRQQGTEFTHYFVGSPLCCPSRSEMYSGRYSHNNGVGDNTGNSHIDLTATLQRYLHDGGYQNALVGKVLMGWRNSTPFPYFDWQAKMTGGYVDVPWNVDGRSVRSPYATTFTGQQTIRYLDTKLLPSPRPWFLAVTPQAPHLPWTPQARYAHAPVPPFHETPAMAETDRADKPPYVRNMHFTYDRARAAEQWPAKQRVLMSADDMIDQVMHRLQAAGALDNTLAILTSDNGYLMSEHGLAKKTVPYEASVRVPFFLRWPHHVAAGGHDSRIVANIDLLPSLVAITGTTPASTRYPIDGRAYLNPRHAGAPRSTLLLEQHTSPDFAYVPAWASLRSKDYQYVEYYASDALGAAVTFREYYNLRHDPQQLDNLLNEHPPASPPPSAATLAALHTRLIAARHCKGAACP